MSTARTGAYVDVVLPTGGDVLETAVASDKPSEQSLRRPQKRRNAARQVRKRPPHQALGDSWQLKDGGGKEEAAFVAAAYEHSSSRKWVVLVAYTIIKFLSAAGTNGGKLGQQRWVVQQLQASLARSCKSLRDSSIRPLAP